MTGGTLISGNLHIYIYIYMCWVVSTLVSLCFNSSVTFLDVPVTKMLVGDWHKKSRGGWMESLRNQARSRSVEVNEITYPSKRMWRPKHLEPPKAAKEQCITLIMSNFSLTYPYYSILIQNVQTLFFAFCWKFTWKMCHFSRTSWRGTTGSWRGCASRWCGASSGGASPYCRAPWGTCKCRQVGSPWRKKADLTRKNMKKTWKIEKMLDFFERTCGFRHCTGFIEVLKMFDWWF